MKTSKEEKIIPITPEEIAASGQYAVYERNPRVYNANNMCVISLPLRCSDYVRTETGIFTQVGPDLTVAFLDHCFPGDIVCVHIAEEKMAYFLSNKGWRKLNRFAPEDLPWKN